MRTRWTPEEEAILRSNMEWLLERRSGTSMEPTIIRFVSERTGRSIAGVRSKINRDYYGGRERDLSRHRQGDRTIRQPESKAFLAQLVESGREDLVRHEGHWTESEEATLRQDEERNIPLWITAVKLGRTYCAVERKRSMIKRAA